MLRPSCRPVLPLVFGLLTPMSGFPASPAELEKLAPRWIWTSTASHSAAAGDSADGSTVRFSRTFTVAGSVQRAELRCAADYCAARVVVNDRTVLDVEPYCQTQTCDVTDAVRRDANEIVVEASPVEGPAAVALSLALVFADGTNRTLRTDAEWLVGSTDAGDRAKARAVDLGAVRPELWGVGRRGIEISPLENYEQWQQAKGATAADEPKFSIAAGFEIERLRRAEPSEGSWIAAAFDAQGRLTISREDRGLLRLTLAEDRRSVVRVETIDVDLLECRGLLYDGDRLYADANNSKGLYRLRVTDDGRAADVERLREFPGNVGHGRNDIAFGPDGELYAIFGDSVDPPQRDVLDRTSPLRDSRRTAPRREAFLVRTDRDGKRWELVCTGLRNPYGVAVHPNGDVFTYDADNEYDMGTPWYRPTRILQLLSGSDYGYRAVSGDWPPNFPDRPDHALPLLDIGRGSPTATLFGTRTSFPPPYRDALFVLDWTYGRIIAVHLMPHGAGYRAATELFVQGKPLNVTDVAAGPDGALYLITGGRKTQSALYRIAARAAHSEPTSPGVHETAAAEFSERRRALRKRLERFHGVVDSVAVDEAWPLLGDADPTVRHAARIAVECQPVATWRERASAALRDGLTTSGSPGSRRTGLAAGLMLLRLEEPSAAIETLADAQVEPNRVYALSEAFERLQLYRASIEQTSSDVERLRPALLRRAAALWPRIEPAAWHVSPYGESRELRRRAALLSGTAQEPDVVGRIAKELFVGSQEDRLAGLLALSRRREGWTPAERRTYFEALNGATRFVGGEGLPTFLKRLRTDAVASLNAEERAKLGTIVDAPKSNVEEPLPPPRPVVRRWTFEELTANAEKSPAGGDARKGAEVFRAALCNRCHRAGLIGPAVGPELTFVARRFSRRDLLQSIVTPSASVAENYRNTEVETEDGRTLVGRMVAEGDFRSEKLLLNVDPLRPGEFVEVDKRAIVASRSVSTSPMPQGLLDSFTWEEIRDLLAFLESGRALN